jgi:hypothetical protein
MPFLEKECYAAFLQESGIREIKDDTLYSLACQGERNWSVCLEDIAAAMRNMQCQGNLTSPETLAILKFVIEKIDRNRGLPPYVTTYMCKDAVTRVILQRFKEEIGETYAGLTELSFKISDNIDEANAIINSIRFCDPAIGSGHFLVTLLNEIIAVKSQLGVLADKEGNPLFRYKVVADNENGLLVYDRKNFNAVKFKSADPESKRIQETLFREKKAIMENCLYGVDTEPVSVSISKLRLWVELLKHVCWEDNQTSPWPVFEGNIRCGDALVSRFPIQEDLRPVFKRLGYSVADYKKWVTDYKNASTQEEKNTLAQFIEQIKKKLLLELTFDDRSNKEFQKWQKELSILNSPSLFNLDDLVETELKAKQLDAQTKVDKYKQKIEDIHHNPIYEYAIEWRYEFPELLNEAGDFMGFDFLIGNPPDTQSLILTDSTDIYKQSHYNVFKRTGDVSSLYYELGYSLLKPEYFLSYITSNSWMKSISADKMRQYLMNETNPLLMIEFSHTGKEKSVLAELGITLLQKARNGHRMMTCQIKDDFDSLSVGLEDYIRQNSELFIVETEVKSVTQGFAVLPDIEKRIKAKIEKSGTPLVSWDIQMHTGIRTGCDDAFVIDGKTKDEFLLADYKNTDIIKPLLLGENIRRYHLEQSNLWLICIPWHFPLLYDKTIKSASEKAEERFRQQYPVIFKHLVKFRERLLTRNTKEVGVIFEWYAVQHFGTSKEWDDFTQPKIVWKREAAAPNFCLDYNGRAIMDTTCFVTGQHLKYLLGVLNSKLGRFMLRDSPRLSNGEVHINTVTLETMKIPIPNVKIESEIITLVNKRTSDAYQSELNDLDDKINQLVYDMYDLDTEEREYIEGDVAY